MFRNDIHPFPLDLKETKEKVFRNDMHDRSDFNTWYSSVSTENYLV